VNAPYVVALHYNVLVDPGVDLAKAQPLCHSEPAFHVRLGSDKAKFTMRQQFATEQDALSVVQPFVDAWNVCAGLEFLPNRFRLEYSHPEIVDPSPMPGVIALQPRNLTIGSPEADRPPLTVHRDQFPSPPTNYRVSPEVNAMYAQYHGHTEGIIPLVHMAYFSLTVLEQGISPGSSAGGWITKKRQMAAQRYAIHVDVLRKMAYLSTERGGATARKVAGWYAELTATEAAWLEAAIKLMIRRAGEIAANPTGQHQQITMADLPKL
jgi:hypothetical protein